MQDLAVDKALMTSNTFGFSRSISRANCQRLWGTPGADAAANRPSYTTIRQWRLCGQGRNLSERYSEDHRGHLLESVTAKQLRQVLGIHENAWRRYAEKPANFADPNYSAARIPDAEQVIDPRHDLSVTQHLLQGRYSTRGTAAGHAELQARRTWRKDRHYQRPEGWPGSLATTGDFVTVSWVGLRPPAQQPWDAANYAATAALPSG